MTKLTAAHKVCPATSYFDLDRSSDATGSPVKSQIKMPKTPLRDAGGGKAQQEGDDLRKTIARLEEVLETERGRGTRRRRSSSRCSQT